MLEIIGHDERAEEDEHSDEDELKGQQLEVTRQKQKLKRIMDMTKANWQVTILKLQRNRPAQTKTLLEKQSEVQFT